MESTEIPIKNLFNILADTSKIKFDNPHWDINNRQVFETSINSIISNELFNNLCVVESDVNSCSRLNDNVSLIKYQTNSLLNEGIFDSILPYIYREHPSQQITDGPSSCGNIKSNVPPKKKKDKRKKNLEKKPIANDFEVEIHVYDEAKGLKKRFTCQHSVLISNMEYFSEITKGQKLDEVDITVHCDISVFEWLLKWIKQNVNLKKPNESKPKLEFKNVVPIMVSSNFLQMKPLFQECLQFSKTHLNEIIMASSNLGCLNDNILQQLVCVMSNVDIQNLQDKKDLIKSSLYKKLIVLLNEDNPQKHLGHYSSSCYLFSCLTCDKLVCGSDASKISCNIKSATINYRGDIVFNHTRDPKWNLNTFIKSIWTEYKSWGTVYWRLWSHCHYLYCVSCHTKYAVAFTNFCLYHPQQPRFYMTEHSPDNTSSYTGRYPCCGTKAILFEAVKIQTGCKLRSHTPKLMTEDEKYIQHLTDLFPNLIILNETANNNITSSLAENYETVTFDNIFPDFKEEESLIAERGLLNHHIYDSCSKMIQKNKAQNYWDSVTQFVEEIPREAYENIDTCSIGESEISDFDNNFNVVEEPSETTRIIESSATVNHPVTTKSKFVPHWLPNRSVRYNQDNVREYEEIAFSMLSSVLISTLDRTNNNDSNLSGFSNIPSSSNAAGSYVKIESEWKEKRIKDNVKTKV